MLFFIKLLPVLLLVGGGAYGYHTVKVNEMSATIAQKESAIVILKSNEEKLIAAEEQNRKAIETMKQDMVKHSRICRLNMPNLLKNVMNTCRYFANTTSQN
jgi:hypothetical protein